MKGATPENLFPKFDYCIDASDPDIVILRRQDASFVAAFSAQGVTKEGLNEAAILGAYPTLRAEDLANAWAYVRSHRDEIDGQIAANDADDA